MVAGGNLAEDELPLALLLCDRHAHTFLRFPYSSRRGCCVNTGSDLFEPLTPRQVFSKC